MTRRCPVAGAVAGTVAPAPVLRQVTAAVRRADGIGSEEERIAETEAVMTKLETIAVRQKSSRVRDIAFALLVVVAGAISLSAVSYAAHAAHTTDVAKR